MPPLCLGALCALVPIAMLDMMPLFLIGFSYPIRKSFLVSQKSPSSVPPRTLPWIQSSVLYHPLIITQRAKDYLHADTHWPKHCLGEPTTVIHRAASHGLFNATSIQPIRVGHGKGARECQIGVPDIFRLLVGELITLWARHPLVKRNGL